MKTRTLAAIMLAATTLSLLSCDWFSKKKQPAAVSSISGKWTIDSTRNETKDGGPDTAKGFWSIAFNHTAPATINFEKDSIYSLYSNAGVKIDSSKYYIDSAMQKLYIKLDTSFYPLSLRALNDSSIEAASDSEPLWYYLKKQP